VLVEVALDRIDDVAAPIVADACTGSGAVSLSIAQERPDATVSGTDLSAEAVALARENALALGLRVEIRRGDLLEPIEGPLDLVTCNPPYIPLAARDDLPPDVRADPDVALFGGPDIVERLYAQAWDRVRGGGWVVVEIEESTGPVVRGLAQRAGYERAEVHADLAGRDRIVAARRP
jgi:release factor glutamine methyltransferase